MHPQVDRELEQTARGLLDLARDAHQAGRLSEAARLVVSGTLCATRAKVPVLASEGHRLGAVHAYAAGEVAVAERGFAQAADVAREGGDEHGALRCEASVAFIDYDRGDASAAVARLDRIDARLRAAGEHPRRRDLEALVLGYRGNLARQQGALDLAGVLYGEAIVRAEPGSVRTTFEMDLAAAELASGDALVALPRLERLCAEVSARPSEPDARPMLGVLLAHYRALARLSAGMPVEIELGDRPALREVRRLLWDATRGGRRRARLEGGLERRLLRLETETEHARLGVRIVRALAGVPDDERVVIVRDGSAIVVRGGVIPLDTRPSLRRVLALLAQGRVATLAEIVEAGWPREKIAPAAARNRAHVALATLRTLGVGAAITRAADGYRLDETRARVT